MDLDEVARLIWRFHRDPRRFKLDQVKLPERVYMKPVRRALEAQLSFSRSCNFYWPQRA